MMIRHMVQRSLSLVVLAGLMSCKGDPTGDLRNGTDHLISDPSSLFVAEAETKLVTVTAVDEQGNTVATRFSEATAVGPGITVEKDLTFQPVFDDKGNLVPPKEVVSTRYKVTATTATANSSFTVSAGGKDITIPVRNTPASTAGLVTASSATPGNGDSTNLTLPAPFKFASTSVASIAGTNLYKVSVSADSSTLRVVAGPGLTGTVSVTNVVLGYAPAAATFTATTAGTVTTPALPTLTANKTNAAVGDTIIVTVPARFKFVPTSAPTVGTAPLSVIGVSADSTQVRFLIGPNANAKIQVTGMRVIGATTLGPFTDTTAAALVSPVVTSFAGTFSNATPAINDTVTLTLPGTMRLLPTSTFTIGGLRALVISRAPDSLSVRIVPSPGVAAAPVSVVGIVFATLKQVTLTLPTSTNLTPPALGAGLAGTGSFATAPTISLPASGQSVTFFDFGAFASDSICINNSALGGKCRIYKLVLGAPTTFTFSTSWQGTTDLGMYFFSSTFVRQSGPCDGLGNTASGQPEVCSAKTLAAGTWYIVVDDFGPFYTPPEAAPTWLRFTFAVN